MSIGTTTAQEWRTSADTARMEAAVASRELARALRARTNAEVRFDPGSRALYSYDASIFRQTPIGVVVPRSAEDVVAAVEVCREFDAPILPRGTGTGLVGQTVNTAVVIDYAKYLDSILELDTERQRARVQPGVICDSLNNRAKAHQLTYCADPATHDHATFGGMIGNNSCGTHSVMGGKTSDNVEEMEVVTYDGLRMRVGATSPEELDAIVAAGGRRGEIYAGLKRIADTYAEEIRTGMPHIPRRVSGYNLDWLLPENGFHVARALVGTEGTCVNVLEATVRLIPSPPKRALAVLGYPGIPSSGDDVPFLMSHHPLALEFTCEHVLANIHAKGLNLGGGDLLPPGEAWLLVEFGGDTQDEADAKAHELADALRVRHRRPTCVVYSTDEEQSEVWAVRRHSAGTSRMPVALGGHGGWPNWEDAALPPEKLGDYLRDYLGLLERYDYDGVFFGHWGQACIHCRIDYDLRTADGVRTYRRFMEEAADLVVAYGGSLSGEHGDGHGRAELWPKMFSTELLTAFKEFKALWDPAGQMNPHKLVDPYPLDSHLREGPGYRPASVQTVLQFPLDGHSFAEAAGRCFGVGKCRHLEGGVMCPSYMVTREEKHSTRGRARLLQEMLRADSPLDGGWRNKDVKEALDLCLACKGCRGECPVQVDMASYKAEFLHHHYKGRLRPRQAYALGLIPWWARLASRMPRLANAATSTPGLATLLKTLAGVAPGRAAPRFADETFTAWFAGHQPRHPDGPPVLLWPDTFVNYFEPQIGIDTVEVLESAGYRVELPGKALCCGRPLYDYGMLTLARRFLRDILDELRPRIEAGVPLVGMEPSCLTVFRDELTNMFPDDLDAQRLRAQSFLLSEFLTRRVPDWPVPQLRRRALVQPHCHHHSVCGFEDETNLLRRMGLDVEIPDSGCCGMAGSFGYEAGERYRVSKAAGERVLLPAVRDASPDTLILADGFSCRNQIAGGSDRTALHLAQVIRLAVREGQDGPAGPYPERVAPSATDEEPSSHSPLVRGLVAAGLAAGTLAGAGAGARAAVHRLHHT